MKINNSVQLTFIGNLQFLNVDRNEFYLMFLQSLKGNIKLLTNFNNFN